MLQLAHCYVIDHWFSQCTLWNEIVAAGTSYVWYVHANGKLDTVIEEWLVSLRAGAGI